VDGFAVFQCNDPQEPRSFLARFHDRAPEANATVALDLALQRGREHLFAPLALNIWTLAQHLFLKIARGLQGARSPSPLF
jgi:hypothetical protein